MSGIHGISRRMVLAGFAVSMAAPALARSVSPRSLGSVVAHNTAVRGGSKRLAAIRTLESQVRITEQGQKLDGRYLATADGMVRVDVYEGATRVFSEGVDSGGAWIWPDNLTAPRAGSDAGKAALLHTILFNLVSLSRLALHGAKLELRPDQAQSGLDCIQVNLADGFETRFFVSTRSGQVVKRIDRRAYHPDVENTAKRIESRFSDFRATQGIVSPWRTEDHDLETGEMVGLGEIVAMKWNVPVDGRIARSAAPAPSPVVP